jgi:hypothetical protein
MATENEITPLLKRTVLAMTLCVVAFSTACTAPADSDDTTDTGEPSVAISAEGTDDEEADEPTVATSADGAGKPEVSEPSAAIGLDPFEQELVGTWHRYHSYDESDEYYVFNADRTGLKYTVAANGSTVDESEITYWALEEQAEGVFRIRLAGPRISSEPEGYLSDDEFHFVDDTILIGGYTSLAMTRQ